MKLYPKLATAVMCALFLYLAPPLLGQDAVPSDILVRTLLIKTLAGQGTAFEIDHRGRLYLVTARHVVAGLPAVSPTISVRRDDKWVEYAIIKILFPSSEDVDIAVLDTGQSQLQPFNIPVAGKTDGMTFGQQVWFLGYPFIEGLGSHVYQSSSQNNANNPITELPFIKRGTMSAIDGRNPNAIVLYIDGFNNPGFSGGPILYYSFSEHAYRIAGVVQGYRNDVARALVNGQQVDTNLLVNSGILVGYSIQHAIDAIDKDLDQKH